MPDHITRDNRLPVQCGCLAVSASSYCHLSVLKCCVPKTLAFAFGLRLRSKVGKALTSQKGHFGPFGECPRGCPRKWGCPRECPKGCLRGPLGPGDTPWDTPSDTPIFGDTLSDTLRDTSGPKCPKDSSGWSGLSQR